MQTDLHASTALLELVVAGYAHGVRASCSSLGGRLGDAHGRRAAVPRRHRGVHGGVAAVRARPDGCGARRCPRPAGCRGGDDGAADAVDHPGHRRPGLAVACARLVRRRPVASPQSRARSWAACSWRRTSTAPAGASSSSSTSRSACRVCCSWPGWSRRRGLLGVRTSTSWALLLAVTLIAAAHPADGGPCARLAAVVVAGARRRRRWSQSRSSSRSAGSSVAAGRPCIPPTVAPAREHAPRVAPRRLRSSRPSAPSCSSTR